MHHPLPNSCTRFQVPDPNGSTTPDYKHLRSAPALKLLKRRASLACPPALCSPSFLSFLLVCSQMKLFLSPAEQRNRLSAALLKLRIPKGEGGRQRPTSCSVWGKPPGQRSQQLPCFKQRRKWAPNKTTNCTHPPWGRSAPAEWSQPTPGVEGGGAPKDDFAIHFVCEYPDSISLSFRAVIMCQHPRPGNASHSRRGACRDLGKCERLVQVHRSGSGQGEPRFPVRTLHCVGSSPDNTTQEGTGDAS